MSAFYAKTKHVSENSSQSSAIFGLTCRTSYSVAVILEKLSRIQNLKICWEEMFFMVPTASINSGVLKILQVCMFYFSWWVSSQEDIFFPFFVIFRICSTTAELMSLLLLLAGSASYHNWWWKQNKSENFLIWISQFTGPVLGPVLSVIWGSRVVFNIPPTNVALHTHCVPTGCFQEREGLHPEAHSKHAQRSVCTDRFRGLS